MNYCEYQPIEELITDIIANLSLICDESVRNHLCNEIKNKLSFYIPDDIYNADHNQFDIIKTYLGDLFKNLNIHDNVNRVRMDHLENIELNQTSNNRIRAAIYNGILDILVNFNETVKYALDEPVYLK
jgi:hypothetical protein